MKVAYLLATGRAKIGIPGTGRVYNFDPWCIINPGDWPYLAEKGYMAGCGCRGKDKVWTPAFGTDQEIRDGLKGFNR